MLPFCRQNQALLFNIQWKSMWIFYRVYFIKALMVLFPSKNCVIASEKLSCPNILVVKLLFCADQLLVMGLI